MQVSARNTLRCINLGQTYIAMHSFIISHYVIDPGTLFHLFHHMQWFCGFFQGMNTIYLLNYSIYRFNFKWKNLFFLKCLFFKFGQYLGKLCNTNWIDKFLQWNIPIQLNQGKDSDPFQSNVGIDLAPFQSNEDIGCVPFQSNEGID